MPEAGWNAAQLLQRADPSVTAREAQGLQAEASDAGLSRALEDRLFDPDPETRSLAISMIPGYQESVPAELLPSLLEDACPDIVLSAAEALATLRSPHACDTLSECLVSRPELAGPLALAFARLEESGAEDLLIDRLGEENPAVRIAVLRALGSSGTQRCRSHLQRYLECGEPAVEAEALAALVRLHERLPHGAPASDLPPGFLERAIARLSGSRDRNANRTLISLLAWLKPREAPSLLLPLLESPDRSVRSRAREAFGLVAASAEASALRAIADAADHAPAAAAAALDRVASVREESSLAACLELTAHGDALVRERAAALAGRSGGPGAAEAVLSLTEDSVGHVRARAAEALGLLRREDAGPALESLLSDTYPDVRQAALAALRAIRKHEVDAEALFDRARDGAARAAALRACDPRRAGVLFPAAVADPDVEVRLAAAMSLNEGEVWLECAAALLADEDPRVRAHALRARLSASAALGLGPLEPLLRDPDAGVRQTFASGLERAEGAERSAWLRRLLFDPSAGVGRAAARALARHRDPDAAGALLEAASTAALPVRAQAIEALGALGDPEALPRLRAVARGGDPALREIAAEAARRVEAVRA
jgi:HEAT repeat protein